MPVRIDPNLRAGAELEKENIFVMDTARANSQDIRPMRMAILNLMPDKEATEKQLLRLIANTPLQVEVVFLRTQSYTPRNADEDYLNSFYKTFEEVLVAKEKFDALIITGAPVEKLDFVAVDYWDELSQILAWATKNVHSSLYICWAAQAALYYHYGIGKNEVAKKIFGVFAHDVLAPGNPLVRGFDDTFVAPHSRYTEVDVAAMVAHPEIDVLATSKEAGQYLAASKDLRRVFVFGHGEYDPETLHLEYVRDKAKGLKTALPKNYYAKGKEGAVPPVQWRAHQALLFSNWLNYCVYQGTPYDLEELANA